MGKRKQIEAAFEQAGFDLEEDNKMAELCDSIVSIKEEEVTNYIKRLVGNLFNETDPNNMKYMDITRVIWDTLKEEAKDHESGTSK